MPLSHQNTWLCHRRAKKLVSMQSYYEIPQKPTTPFSISFGTSTGAVDRVNLSPLFLPSVVPTTLRFFATNRRLDSSLCHPGRVESRAVGPRLQSPRSRYHLHMANEKFGVIFTPVRKRISLSPLSGRATVLLFFLPARAWRGLTLAVGIRKAGGPASDSRVRDWALLERGGAGLALACRLFGSPYGRVAAKIVSVLFKSLLAFGVDRSVWLWACSPRWAWSCAGWSGWQRCLEGGHGT